MYGVSRWPRTQDRTSCRSGKPIPIANKRLTPKLALFRQKTMQSQRRSAVFFRCTKCTNSKLLAQPPRAGQTLIDSSKQSTCAKLGSFRQKALLLARPTEFDTFRHFSQFSAAQQTNSSTPPPTPKLASSENSCRATYSKQRVARCRFPHFRPHIAIFIIMGGRHAVLGDSFRQKTHRAPSPCPGAKRLTNRPRPTQSKG